MFCGRDSNGTLGSQLAHGGSLGDDTEGTTQMAVCAPHAEYMTRYKDAPASPSMRSWARRSSEVGQHCPRRLGQVIIFFIQQQPQRLGWSRTPSKTVYGRAVTDDVPSPTMRTIGHYNERHIQFCARLGLHRDLPRIRACTLSVCTCDSQD